MVIICSSEVPVTYILINLYNAIEENRQKHRQVREDLNGIIVNGAEEPRKREIINSDKKFEKILDCFLKETS